MKKPSEIYIDVRGPNENKSLSLTLPWDSNLEDWKEAFVTILTHQSFAPETIKDLFYDESTETDSIVYMGGSDFDVDRLKLQSKLNPLFETHNEYPY